jgi:hypothetical protein
VVLLGRVSSEFRFSMTGLSLPSERKQGGSWQYGIIKPVHSDHVPFLCFQFQRASSPSQPPFSISQLMMLRYPYLFQSHPLCHLRLFWLSLHQHLQHHLRHHRSSDRPRSGMERVQEFRDDPVRRPMARSRHQGRAGCARSVRGWREDGVGAEKQDV